MAPPSGCLCLMLVADPRCGPRTTGIASNTRLNSWITAVIHHELVLFTLPTLFTLLQVQVCRALMRPRPGTVQHKAPLPRRGTDRGAPASACAPKSLGSAALLAGVPKYDEAEAEIERRREALGLPTIDWAPDASDAAQSLAALCKPTSARGGRRPPTRPV